MNNFRKARLLGVCLCVAVSGAAVAQYNPSATMDLGASYGALNMSQGNLSLGQMELSGQGVAPGRQARTPPTANSDATVDSRINELVNRRVQSLAPEYRQHLRVADVKTANQWLVGQVFSPDFKKQLDALLAPAYARRVQQDGKASADVWLASRGREIGHRAGAAAKHLRQEHR